MNIMFWVLLILIFVVLWFLLSFIFKPTGKLFSKIVKDTIDILEEDDTKEEIKESEEKEE